MKVDIDMIHFFLEEHDRPKVVHQQGNMILNFDLYDYRIVKSDLQRLIIQFKTKDQIRLTIEALQDLLDRLDKGDERTIEILFDNDDCRRYKF